MEQKFVVSTSPHIYSTDSIPRIMWSVVIALLPAGAMGVWLFGLHTFWVILTCVIVAVVTEAAGQKLVFGQKITITDGSAVITGLLLAYTLPPGLPLWAAATGSVFAIFVAKLCFGGLGYNIFNPALIGRAVLLASWPAQMTTWVAPFAVDGVSCASPLAMVKTLMAKGTALTPSGTALPSVLDMFFGNCAGAIGEVSAIALLGGAIFLFIRKIISWHTPLTYIGTVALVSFLFGRNPLFEIFAGGLFLGAFFMATDMVTVPITGWGKIIFGIGAGVMTALIRNIGGYPEGVCYSILLMNAVTPHIDRLTTPKKFGLVKK
jgi:electron transport complex protein RnfD